MLFTTIQFAFNKADPMRMRRVILLVSVALSLGSVAGMSQTNALPPLAPKAPLTARFEHLAFNVADPQAVVRWYTTHMGMTVVRADGPPAHLTFITDSSRNVMLEFQHHATNPLFDPSSLHHMTLHLAFNTPDIVNTQKRLLAAGATVAESLKTSAAGDQIVTLRDPWGLPLQLVQRKIPMLSRTGQYLEHVAINTEDSRTRAKWYSENLGFTVIQDGAAPAYAVFTADAGKRLMFELFQFKQYPVQDFRAIHPGSLHVGIMVDDIDTARDLLTRAGATVVELHHSAQGDSFLVMRDPWGFPLHVLKRVKPILK